MSRRTLDIWSKKKVLTAVICMYCEEIKIYYFQIPIIQRECEAGSVIHSDEWPVAYRCLNGIVDIFIKLKPVNHQQNYVDLSTGAHTQSIERTWLDAKTKIMKTMRGTTKQVL